MTAITVLILDITVMGLAGLMSFLSYLTYREKDEIPYLYGCFGFGILGASTILTDAVTLLSSDMGLMADHTRGVMMVIGFGLLVYGGEIAE